VNGLSVDNEDIVAFDGTNFELYFDGSDVGLSDFTIDAFAIIGDTEILMSFTKAGSVPNISGTVDDSDIVKFTGSLGSQTSGTFELYFDGSDLGLTRNGEDIDAIEVELASDGAVLRLLLSTTGKFRANGLSGADEDIFACNSPATGPNTACESLTPYFDGSDVGLSGNSEDVDGLAVSSGGIYLSTSGNFSTNDLSGADEDVFLCNTPGTGTNTSCSFFTPLFDGSAYGLGGNDIFAFDLP
jgi:hypothetical protein